jgi:hypothetical protein
LADLPEAFGFFGFVSRARGSWVRLANLPDCSAPGGFGLVEFVSRRRGREQAVVFRVDRTGEPGAAAPEGADSLLQAAVS